MSRKIYYWKLRESELQLGERTLIMGILNITPDSFSDGGRYFDPDLAYARALELEEQGADIIDIGAESTRPGSRRITADEEWQRLVPVLKRLRGNVNVPLSIDTYKAEIAQRALEYGVEIINDPTGLTFDPEIVKAAANGNAGLIVSHMRGTPETWAKLPPMPDPAGTVVKDLDATINRARRGGVDKARIVVDPGLGFGKRKEQNSEIIANLKQFAALDCPILVGPSRKHFLAQETETGTLFATAAAVTASILYGAHIVRVHDVKEMVPVVRMADEIATMPVIAARQAEAAAERAAERAARKASAPQAHIEEPKRKAARPPLAVVAKPEPPAAPPAPEPAAAEPMPLEAAVPPPSPPAQRVLRPAAAPKREPREDRGGWGPPRRRESGFGPKPPFKRRDDRDRGAEKPRRFEGKPGARPPFDRSRSPREGREQPPRRSFGPPRGDERRPFRRDEERPRGEARPPRGERTESGKPPFGKPPFGKPASGKPRSGKPPSGRKGGGPHGRPFRKRP